MSPPEAQYWEAGHLNHKYPAGGATGDWMEVVSEPAHYCSTAALLFYCFHLELSALPALAPFCSACQRIALQAIMDMYVCNSALFCNRCSYSSKVKSCCLLCILALYPCTAPLHCAVALYPYTVSLPVIVLCVTFLCFRVIVFSTAVLHLKYQ